MPPVLKWIPSPNWRAPRRLPREISAIVLHYTASMSLAGTVSWFKNPGSKVSAHYVIDRDGSIVQMVADSQIAYHAGESSLQGRSNVNEFSLGIELVGTADSGFTVQQIKALYDLLAYLCVKYLVPVDRIVGHKHVAPKRKIDPDGYEHQFDWMQCRSRVTAIIEQRLAKGGTET
jgi:N-acetylmuramoyl-L-alanine amidase